LKGGRRGPEIEKARLLHAIGLERQSLLEPKPKNRLAAPVYACLGPPPRTIEGRCPGVLARCQEGLSVSVPPKPLNHFIQECGPVTAPLSAVDYEQRPNVTRLMVGAGKALNPCIILRNKEDRLVQIPLDFRGCDERGVVKPIFGGSMPHLGNARQVEFRGLAQAREHVEGRLAGAASLIQSPFCGRLRF